MEEKDIKEVLLGSVRKDNGREKELDLSLFKEPFEGENSVVYFFCQSCGGVLELTAEGAQKLVELAGIEKPETFSGYYFLTQGCPLCGNDLKSVGIKKLA